MHLPKKSIWTTVVLTVLTQGAKQVLATLGGGAASTFPWTPITVCLLCFLAGQFVQDCFNPTSWVRLNVRDLNRLFQQVECWWDQPPNDPIRREAYSRLVLSRDVKDAELRVWGYQGVVPPFLIETRTGIRGAKGTDLRVVLASTGIHPEAGYGPRFGGKDSDRGVNPNEVKLVLLEMRCGWRKQTCGVEIYMYAPGRQWQIHPMPEERSAFLWPDMVRRAEKRAAAKGRL